MNFKVLRILGVVMLVLGAISILLVLMEGKKSVIHSIGSGGVPIMVGGLLLGRSLRLENQSKASSHSPPHPGDPQP